MAIKIIADQDKVATYVEKGSNIAEVLTDLFCGVRGVRNCVKEHMRNSDLELFDMLIEDVLVDYIKGNEDDVKKKLDAKLKERTESRKKEADELKASILKDLREAGGEELEQIGKAFLDLVENKMFGEDE